MHQENLAYFVGKMDICYRTGQGQLLIKGDFSGSALQKSTVRKKITDCNMLKDYSQNLMCFLSSPYTGN